MIEQKAITTQPTYQSVEYYLDLKWEYLVQTGYYQGKRQYMVKVKDFPQLESAGTSLDEVMKDLRNRMEVRIKNLMSQGKIIPEPTDESRYSGSIAYRTSSTIHGYIDRAAKHKNLSLSKTIDILILEAFKHLHW